MAHIPHTHITHTLTQLRAPTHTRGPYSRGLRQLLAQALHLGC